MHTTARHFIDGLLESGIDYHRVLTSEPVEQVLARFLVGRAAARGLR